MLQGSVSSSEGDRRLAGITVEIPGMRRFVLTGPDGEFTVGGLPVGEHTVIFRWLGYRPHERVVRVAPGEATRVEVRLEPEPIPFGEISITSVARQPERVVSASAAVAMADATATREISMTAQAAQVFNSMTGVDVVSNGIFDFNISTRGLNSSINSRVLVLQDGRDISVPFVGAPEWSALAMPIEDMERFEMVRGPGSALYGANAYSGVVNIVTPTARQVQGTKVSVAGGELSTFKADVRHAGVTDDLRFGYRLNAGYYRSDTWGRSRTDFGDLEREYEEAIDTDRYPIVPPPPGFELAPLNGQTTGQPTGVPAPANGDIAPLENLYGSARFDYYADDGSVLTAEGGTARVQNQDYLLGIGRLQIVDAHRPWARVAWAAERLNVMAYYSGRLGDDQTALAAAAPVKENSNLLHAEAQYNQGFADERGRFVLGVSARRSFLDSEGTILPPRWDDRADGYYSAFGQLEYDLAPTLRFVGALRYDDGTLLSGEVSPKLAVVFSPTPSQSIRVSANRAYHVGNTAEHFLTIPAGAPLDLRELEEGLRQSPLGPALADVPEGQLYTNSAAVPLLGIGNEDLKVEHIASLELGYKGQLGERAFLTVDGFYGRLSDFITDLLPGANPAFEPWQAPAGVAADGRAAVEAASRQAIGPGLTNLADGTTAFVVSFGNAGEADMYGVEVGGSVRARPDLDLGANYTYFDFEVNEESVIPGAQVSPNTPKHKGNVFLSYRGPQGLRLRVDAHLVSAFDWVSGVYVGRVPDRQTVDLTGGYQLNNHVRLQVAGTNVFDQRRYQFFGGAVVGRRVLAGLSLTF